MPVSYNFLSKYLLCPSIVTLNSQLANIPLQAGCIKLIRKYLKQVAQDIHDERDKFVVLIWDEISLQPALIHDKTHDKIIGFKDWGHRRTRKIADHAITFYLRCLKTGNKMPLGFGFCESCTKTHQLVRCIKEWLSCIIECGLVPVATVCDQSASNIAAINILINESNKICTTKNAYTSKYNTIIILLNNIFINNHVRRNKI